MQTLEVEDGGEEQGSRGQIIRQKGAQSSAEAISNQSEMIEVILSRLPVKTLLQFRCVSKPWRNLISDQSFVKLHSTHTNRHGLVIVISAYNTSNFKSHLLFAGHNGGSITQFLTIPDPKIYPEYFSTQAVQHVNGLLLFCPGYGFDKNYLAFVSNPSTRKIFKVPPCGYDVPEVNKIHYCYLLGFDEWCSEHKILNFKTIGVYYLGYFNPIRVEIEIFSLSTYTWRKIDVDFPPDLDVANWYQSGHRSVCINSAIYFMFLEMKSILVFDLRTETFSNMNFPPVNSLSRLLSLMTINGFLGVVCHERIADHNKMEFWILEDCQNQVWVKDTITLPDCWIDKNHTPCPLDFRGSEIVFKPNRVSTDLLSIPIYDMKKGTFRSLEVDLSHDVLCFKMIDVCEVRSYVESMISLKNSPELVPFISGKGNEKKVQQIPKELICEE